MRKFIAFLIILAFGAVMFNSCGGSKSSKEIVISELTEPCDFAKAFIKYYEEGIVLLEELTEMVENVGDREPTPSEESRAESILAQLEDYQFKFDELEERAEELGISDEEIEACPEYEKFYELMEKAESIPGLRFN